MDLLAQFEDDRVISRLWERDASLFSRDPETVRKVAVRLGWLGLAAEAEPILKEARQLAADLKASGIRHVVLLGMGGSSLAPLVMDRVLPHDPEAPELIVCDTSSPSVIAPLLDSLEPKQTAFFVSSKSGGTIEPLSLYAVFRAWADEALGREVAGDHFIAVTDPGSPLASLARDDGFRYIFFAPTDVGGRYSALTAFGLAPAVCCGLDAASVLANALQMEEACKRPACDNPGALLASDLMSAYHSGRDKLTLVASKNLVPFGSWIEQLIAESTGKSGKGLVPIIERDVTPEDVWGSDRIFVVIRWTHDERLARFTEVIDDAHEIGAEFVRWETATALAGYTMQIDPFDEPNVTEAKKNTAGLLDGAIATSEPTFSVEGADITYASPIRIPSDIPDLQAALEPYLHTLGNAEFLAILAYLPEDEVLLAPLYRAARDVAIHTLNAVTVQIGPRYLHSTGQLHKGGANLGVFIIITATDEPYVSVPGKDYDLAELLRAQANGDMVTLASHGRRVIGIDLTTADIGSLTHLGQAIVAALR